MRMLKTFHQKLSASFINSIAYFLSLNWNLYILLYFTHISTKSLKIEFWFGASEHSTNGVWALQKKSRTSNVFFRPQWSHYPLFLVSKKNDIYELNLCYHILKSLQGITVNIFVDTSSQLPMNTQQETELTCLFHASVRPSLNHLSHIKQ